ncbi:MAG: DUF309 domain-containing protein, partial [Candidatus Omnitrophica bacterium]|nr:DUF309 domain-containing protein [Candidatus Omnitrophota bacterium]
MSGNCPPMSVDERFRRGIELFNQEEFFECHEVIEDLWLETQDEYKNLYKGVIQAAVALHHLRRGNLKGAKKLFKTSSGYLSYYPSRTLGLNVEKLLSDMKICFKSLDLTSLPKLE